MMIHPNFDPIAFAIGPLAVRWYGLMYLIAFVLFMVVGRLQIARRAHVNSAGWTGERIDDLLFYGVLGVILGGRLGYVLFYKPGYYLSHPLEILAVWQGGMAFHGGFLGVLVAMWLWGRKHQLHWLTVTDFIAPLVPLGLAAGRMGNFINGELWGRAAGTLTNPSVPWAMIFPQAGDNVPRHPSQLYQFALEGLALFVVLWLFSAKPRPMGRVSAVFLIGYGALRFIAEFGREPDAFLGLLAGGFSMGQWLSLPMVAAGVWMWVWARKYAPKPA
jgi:phosphatidylglycerol---prolipoprotein diacylglyceryl transferase